MDNEDIVVEPDEEDTDPIADLASYKPITPTPTYNGKLGPPHRGMKVLIRGDLASYKPCTPPLSKTRSLTAATLVEAESELGFDMRQCKEVPLQLLKADVTADRNIEAFYGYNEYTKQYCVSYEGGDEYVWLRYSELRGVNPK